MSDEPAQNEREVLARVGWAYYEENLTQAQIAELLHVSRPTVARLLERARATGVVSISVDTAALGDVALVQALKRRYRLQDVVIVPTTGPASSGIETNSQIAAAAAHYLRRYLMPGAVIGLGWGDTVLRTLSRLPHQSIGDVTFATLTGGIDAYLVRVTSGESPGLNDRIRFAPAPLLASSPAVAAALREEPAVLEVLEAARSASATLIGIGAAAPTATILQHGVISRAQLDDYIRRGAVGDIVGDWYDRDGELLALDLSQVRVGLSITELRSMPNVVAVAGGIDKTRAIEGALVGGYLDVLVTTEDVAKALVDS